MATCPTLVAEVSAGIDATVAERLEPRPSMPQTASETGLTESLIEGLMLKTLYARGEMSGRDLSRSLGLQFSVLEPIVERFKHSHLVAVKRSLGFGNISAVLSLSDAGRRLALEAMELNQYVGPAPVPLALYEAVTRAQRLEKGWLTPAMLSEAYRHMVVSPEVLNQVGPAVNSGASLLIYGQPGNGKTYLAEALFKLQTEPVYIPYAIECQGNIVTVFDPVCHVRVESDEADEESVFFEQVHDGRWARCRRPFIVTGGELTARMLDLSYNETTHVYEAPFQLKANNGMYLIDDFGRQHATPAEILNRWIVPMERRIDYLTFGSGKMAVPFEAFLIFSTNLAPDQLGDEAFLRRIAYKLFLRSPDQKEFMNIFCRACNAAQLEYTTDTLERFVRARYTGLRRPFRRCHPRDIIAHATDIISYEKRPSALTEEVLDLAFESCFVTMNDKAQWS